MDDEAARISERSIRARIAHKVENGESLRAIAAGLGMTVTRTRMFYYRYLVRDQYMADPTRESMRALSDRTGNALVRAGYNADELVAGATDAELLASKGIGRRHLEEIRRVFPATQS